MDMPNGRTVIGLMSGTSLDGIDAALVRTDGVAAIETGRFLTLPYDQEIRDALRACLGIAPDTADADQRRQIETVAVRLTSLHAVATAALIRQAGLTASAVDLIGFHGHTVFHHPTSRRTWQIGDGSLLSHLTGIPVVSDFRTTDVLAGGEGAPLVPLFHRALADALPKPLAILNIGGVANVTWLGEGVGDAAPTIAGDTGPGNALVDDWIAAHGRGTFDDGGQVAARGTVHQPALTALIAHPYFDRPLPKSLDRQDFITAVSQALPAGLSVEDGAATLTAFTAAAVARVVEHLPTPPRQWLVTGGGRHNATLMAMLSTRLAAQVSPVESVGWQGDALEAQAFAYLAVRSRLGLPLSLPGTTGVPQPLSGGRFHPRAYPSDGRIPEMGIPSPHGA